MTSTNINGYYVAREKGSGKTKTLSNKEHKASELPRVI